MNSKVKVVADDTNTVLHQSRANPEYGYIRLVQERNVIDESGFFRIKQVSTLLHGKMDDLQMMNFTVDQEMPGQIIVQESMDPFNKKDPTRDYKIAGETGIMCTVKNQPIYRRTIYSTKPNVEDVTIQHDNKEELQAAYAKQNSTSQSAVNASNSDFTLDAN